MESRRPPKKRGERESNETLAVLMSAAQLTKKEEMFLNNKLKEQIKGKFF